jgi:GntR family transcriptional regulator
MMQTVPRADTMGFVTHLPAALLERIARLRTENTISLLTQTPGTIEPLTTMLRVQSGFNGQILAAAVEEGTEHIASFLDQGDLVLYTPESRRRVRPIIDSDVSQGAVRLLVSPDSLEAIRNSVPA